MSLFNPTQESFAWPPSDIQGEEESNAQDDENDTQPEPQPEEAEDLPYSSDTPSDDDLYSEVPDRPNRWRGTRRKLEVHYANERTLLDSLSALDDDDLSMHLYNVHGLKRGIYPDFSSTNDAVRDDHKDWMRKERLLESSQEWYPHRSWTQWPLEPAVVPRGDERATWVKKHHGDVEGARKDIARRLELRPSHDLEELLLAEFTKQARVRFEAREWNMENARSDADRMGSEAAHDVNQKRSTQSAHAQGSSAQEWDSRKRQKLAPAMSPSLTQGKAPNTPKEVTLKPVPTGDDSYARSIAQPIISSCIANLDSLLRGLHHSRANHTRIYSARPRRKSAATASANAATDTETEGSSSESQHPPSSAKLREWRERSPGPRDWSEVLGMAALVGWDPEVVRRARDRCQRLFAEAMSLHSVDEGPYDDVVVGADMGDQSALRDGEIMHGGVHLDGFMQPIRRGAKTGSKKGTQKKLRAAVSRVARTSRSADQNQAEDEEPGQADTVSMAPVGADKEAEEHVCKDCGTTSTPKWRLQADESWLCNSCHLYFRKHRRHKGNVRDMDRRANREARSVGPMQ